MMQGPEHPAFLHESMQLFGGVDDDLLAWRSDLLGRIPPRSRETRPPTWWTPRFARRAREEIDSS